MTRRRRGATDISLSLSAKRQRDVRPGSDHDLIAPSRQLLGTLLLAPRYYAGLLALGLIRVISCQLMLRKPPGCCLALLERATPATIRCRCQRSGYRCRIRNRDHRISAIVFISVRTCSAHRMVGQRLTWGSPRTCGPGSPQAIHHRACSPLKLLPPDSGVDCSAGLPVSSQGRGIVPATAGPAKPIPVWGNDRYDG